jgi:hypothetical protein
VSSVTLRPVSVHCFNGPLTSTGSLIGLVARGAVLTVARRAVLAGDLVPAARRAVFGRDLVPAARRTVVAGVLASACRLVA